MRWPANSSDGVFCRMVRGVGERELVVHRMRQPARGEGGRHPAAPLQHEIRGDEELDDAGDDRDRRQRHEDQHELVPERDPVRFVGDLDGVAEIPLEEVETQRQRDLELIDQDEEEDVDAGVNVLPQDDRPAGQGPDRDRRPRGEERIGDRHHPAHQAKVGDRENGENEQRRRQRQIAGQLIFLVGCRPIAQERDEVGQAEQHRFDREEIAEEGEEGRHLPARQRSDRGQPRGDADEQRHPVFFVGADNEGEDGEGGEAQHAHAGQDLERTAKRRKRTIRPTRALEGPCDGSAHELLAMSTLGRADKLRENAGPAGVFGGCAILTAAQSFQVLRLVFL